MFCNYLNKRIQDLSRELYREFTDWDNMLTTAIKNRDRKPVVTQKTMEFRRRRDMLSKERDEFQQILDVMKPLKRAPGAQV